MARAYFLLLANMAMLSGVVIVMLSGVVIGGTPTTALLELNVNHEVAVEVRPQDPINYTCVVRHKDTSTLDAVDIKVEIMLPVSMQFIAATVIETSHYTRVIHNAHRVDYIIPTLSLQQSQVHFNFVAVITEEGLQSGLHYASTPIKLSYNSLLDGGEVTEHPHMISTVAQVPYFIASCIQPLGVGNGDIKFYQFSSSSTQVDLKPDKARDNGVDDAWCADVRDNRPYIQVFLTRFSKVTGIATWGRKEKALWVKKYTVEFSKDGNLWFAYADTGITKQFDANFDQQTKVMQWLTEPFEANYIRLYPMQWSVGVCMRLELYGCSLVKKDNCLRPLGMENGDIPLSAITAKLPPAAGFADSRNWSRLNSVVREFPNGWMADFAAPDYLQIDLGSMHQLSAIAVQGGYGDAAPYVTKFQVSHSMDLHTWNKRPNDEDEEPDFPGSAGGRLADMVYFNQPFDARYVRIIPIEASMVKSMRLELYGCLKDDHMEMTNSTGMLLGSPHLTRLSRRSVLIDEVGGSIYVCIFTHDKDRSICKRSDNGQHWTSLGPNIMAVLHQVRGLGTRLFAVDRNFHKTISDDNGVTWYTISDVEWQRQLDDVTMTSLTNIEDILPTTLPDSRYTWTTQKGKKWGVSGHGVHVMGSRSVEWQLAASWKCCGM